MAVYKVIQDVEAEDKLLGPLSLKAFIYAGIAGTLAFINVRLALSTLGPIKWAFFIAFLFPMILFAVLASPLGHEQPTEVWLLSHVRFLLKKRKRLWEQGDQTSLVTITAPKKEERHLTKDFSQIEVSSRLVALATTLDSRGWATKNAAVNLSQSAINPIDDVNSDRLVATSSLPQDQPVLDVHEADDIMDEQNNPTAQKFNVMMQEADSQRKQAMQDKIQAARQASQAMQTDNWVAPEIPDVPDTIPGTVFGGGNTKLEERLQKARTSFEAKHAPKPKPVKAAAVQKTPPAPKPAVPAPKPTPMVTAAAQAAKLELAQSGNDLSVASIAHLANRGPHIEQISANEVLITLH